MKKLKLFFTYILVLFASPKKAAEAANGAENKKDLDERISKLL